MLVYISILSLYIVSTFYARLEIFLNGRNGRKGVFALCCFIGAKREKSRVMYVAKYTNTESFNCKFVLKRKKKRSTKAPLDNGRCGSPAAG